MEIKGTPFSTGIPIRRWHGRTSCILQVESATGGYEWIFFNFEEPESFAKLDCQTDNKNETIFFNGTSRKFLRVANDCLYWSYYVSGPFQRFDDGTWIEATQPQQGDQKNAQLVFKNPKEKKAFSLDYLTGLLTKVEYENNEEEKQESSEIKEASGIYKKLKELSVSRKGDPEVIAKGKAALEELKPILEKMNQHADVKVWKEAVIKGEGENHPTISSNIVVKTWEAIADIYHIGFEFLRSSLNDSGYLIFPTESMNDVKFVLGVIIPEACLYAHTFYSNFKIPQFKFCGKIKTKAEISLGYIDLRSDIAIDCTEKNIMKIQRAFHLSLFNIIYRSIKALVPDFEVYWVILNAPDVSYNEKRQKIPKGYKGFLNSESSTYVHCDVAETYFALMKDPNTLLNHQDIIIAKKAHLLKTTLSTLYPNYFNEEWWESINNHWDIIEIAKNSKETFKEAHIPDDQDGDNEK